VCQHHPSFRNLVIGNTSGSVLVDRFGNKNRSFIDGILKHLKKFYTRRDSVTVPWSNDDTIASISIIPSDFIGSTDTNLFQVGSNSRIIMLTCTEYLI